MKRVILVLLLISNPVHARLFKCINNGQVTYQEQPCVKSGVELKERSNGASSMVGCYETTYPGMDGGKNTERYEIKGVGNGNYEMVNLIQSKAPVNTMRQATPDDLRELNSRAFMLDSREGRILRAQNGNTSEYSKASKLDFKEGVVFSWAPNQKPVGLYRVRDSEGHEKYFYYVEIASLIATKIQCP